MNNKQSFQNFMLYLESIPEEFIKIENLQTSNFLFKQFDFTEDFFKDKNNIVDKVVDTNQNTVQPTPFVYFNDVQKPLLKTFSLYYIYKYLKEHQDEIGSDLSETFIWEQVTGGIYVHDLHHAQFIPYCYQYSVEEIVKKGLPFITSIKSTPAKHLSTFIEHVIQFITFQSNSSSGQVGLPDFFVWFYYFLKKDEEQGIISSNQEEKRRYIHQQFQIFTYSINQPIRGTQSPFVNLTYLDRNYLKQIYDGQYYPDGEQILDHIEEIIQLQKEYWRWIRDEREKTQFTFPVLTQSLLFDDNKKEFIDKDSQKFIQEVNTKWQETNIYQQRSIDAIASCCRLLNSIKMIKNSQFQLNFEEEVEELKGMQNSIGGTDMGIGSFKVITINLPRIQYEQRNEDEFFEILERKVKLVHQQLYQIRKILEERISKGYLPLYTLGFMKLDRQFGTVGINGIFEQQEIMNMIKWDLDGVKYTEQGEQFVEKLLTKINQMNKEQFKKYKISFNLEQVPAERQQYINTQKDKIYFSKIKQQKIKDYILYQNQWLPLTQDADLTNRIKYQQKFDKLVSGGQILHINLMSEEVDKNTMFNMMKQIQGQGCIYFQFNKIINVCENDHSYIGNSKVCPVCGQNKKDEMFRIVGYLVPIQNFGEVRRKYDYPKRVMYSLSKQQNYSENEVLQV